MSPERVDVGNSGITLTVRGANFRLNSVVRLNDANRTTTLVSSTELRAQLPASDFVTPAPFAHHGGHAWRERRDVQ